MAPTSEVSRTGDPLLAPPAGFEPPPLVSSEMPPLRPSLLDYTPGTRRLENLDALRIVCMLVIILSHVTEPFLDTVHKRYAETGLTVEMSSPLYLGTLVVNVCGRFGVPCFMMISFYIYWHQLYEKGRSWGQLLSRRLRRLLPAFLCWSLFYFAVHKLLFKTSGRQWTSSLQQFRLRDWHVWFNVFVLGQAEIHLYYLPLLIECMLLIPLLKLLWRVPLLAWTWIIATAAVWALGAYGVFFPHASIVHRAGVRTYHWLTHPGVFLVLPFLVFPLFGMMFAGQNPFRQFVARSGSFFWIGLLGFGLALHATESIALTKLLPGDVFRANVLVKVGRIISGVAVFGLFIRHPLMRDPFPRLSHHAFGLHFMHPAIILLLSIAEFKLLGPNVAAWRAYVLPMLVLNLVLTVSITFGLCLLIGRSRRLEFLVV